MKVEFVLMQDLQGAIDRHRASIEKTRLAIAASEARCEQEVSLTVFAWNVDD